MSRLKRIAALLVIVLLSSATVAGAGSVGQDGSNLGDDVLKPATMCDNSGNRKPGSVSMTEQGRDAINRVAEEANSGSIMVLPGKDDVKKLARLRPDSGQRQLDVKISGQVDVVRSGQTEVIGPHIAGRQISAAGLPQGNVTITFPPAIPMQYQMRPRRCR